MSDEISDEDIRLRLSTDDPSALDMIWNAYASDLLGYLVSILCSRHDAEDALQEVFVIIARKRSAVAGARRLKPYLFKLSRNVALNRIKREKRRRNREAATWHWIEAVDGENEDSRIGELEAALASLPEKQRAVVLLKYFRDKTFRDIGDILGVSENTAASRYRYGMAKLKRTMRTQSQ